MSVVVYVDTSVVLAHLRSETIVPPESLWEESLISSRLLHYETFSRLHATGAYASHGEVARDVLRTISVLELVEPVVGRAQRAFPVHVRTLDALHLASMLFLVEQGVKTRLASYDRRLKEAAAALGIGSYPL